ncbi:MAG: alpha/beta hydrolase [Pseudomonadota bacterium]
MDIEKIHPELQQAFRRIPPLPFHNRLFVNSMNFLIGLAPGKKEIDGVIISKKTLTNAGLRIYQPNGDSSGAGLLWIHGGGMITGRATQDDQTCANYARDLNLVVVSVDYRLAPKHPFPVPLDDCYEVWQWFTHEADNLGVDPSRIAISGQSAGGCLAASLAQKILDAGGVQPAAQALFCPMLDDRTAADPALDAIKHRVWNNKSNRAGWSAYLGHSPGESDVPAYAAPARRDELAGLPPTWVGIGDIDLFYEEARLYAQRLNEANVNCQFHTVPMAPHAFETFVPRASITQDFYQDNYQFLQEALSL